MRQNPPGQSGSGSWVELPEYEGYYVVGIHAYGCHDKNQATRITTRKFKKIISWMENYQMSNFIHPNFSSAEELILKTLYETRKALSKKEILQLKTFWEIIINMV